MVKQTRKLLLTWLRVREEVKAFMLFDMKIIINQKGPYVACQCRQLSGEETGQS